jgi:hypothetical protein
MESPHVPEPDHRRSQGIDVNLLWNARADEVSIAVTDERSGEALTFVVDPTEASSAFHHPYAYAPPANSGNGHTSDVETE